MAEQARDLQIGIYRNASDQFTQIDLTFLNLKICKLESPEFKYFLDSILADTFREHNHEVFEDFVSNSSGYHPYEFALIPIDLQKEVKEEVFSQLEVILLLLFPSEFALESVVNIERDIREPKKYSVSSWSRFRMPIHYWVKREISYEPILLDPLDSELDSINLLIKFIFTITRSGKNYWDLALKSYHNSFKQDFPEMAYVSLCISLESLIQAKNEITDKISRTCAVINSSSISDGQIVYKNLKKLYGLRSGIVHGEGVKKVEFSTYYTSLEAVVSRTILLLIGASEITSREMLGEKINSSGFGSFLSNHLIAKVNLQSINRVHDKL